MEWQNLITGVFVGIAALSIGKRILGLFSSRRGQSCGTCGGCSGKSPPAEMKSLVQLGSPRTRLRD